MLSDISLGRASNEVRQFVCDAYLRGARIGNAENCAFEGSTAVMTKRRYRDRWNRIMTRRVYCNGTRIHHSGFSTGGAFVLRWLRASWCIFAARGLKEAQSFDQDAGSGKLLHHHSVLHVWSSLRGEAGGARGSVVQHVSC